MTGNSIVDHAIPHEAGHVVIAWILGFPIAGVAMDIVKEDGRIQLGNFITGGIAPTDEGIAITPVSFLEIYKMVLAGGLAGERFSGVATAEVEGLEEDRRQLARVGTESLEEIAERAVQLIHENRRIFRRLNSRITQRFLSLMNDPALATGRHTLLTHQELTEIFARR